MDKYLDILSQYLPAAATKPVYDLIIKHKVHLIITRSRKSKLGDFRPAHNGKPARISINHNLNQYAFLLTFLHELAHFLVWEKYRKRLLPHGKEWQSTFKQLQQPFLSDDFFPEDILEQLYAENRKITAASLTDTKMARVLKKYNPDSAARLLESLPENSLFDLPDGRRFKKLNKRRKNYLCYCLSNKRNYIFNPLAEVFPVED